MVKVLEKPIQPAVLCAALVKILEGQADTEHLSQETITLEQSTIDIETISDLDARLGRTNARGFMLRALSEAASVLDELRQDGIGRDTGRRLHAATGASGLTGLCAVEQRLRAVEKAVDAGGSGFETLLDPLDQVINLTRQAIDTTLPALI